MVFARWVGHAIEKISDCLVENKHLGKILHLGKLNLLCVAEFVRSQ